MRTVPLGEFLEQRIGGSRICYLSEVEFQEKTPVEMRSSEYSKHTNLNDNLRELTHPNKGTRAFRVLEFLAAADSVDSLAIRRLAYTISEEEWTKRQLSPATMEKLGLHGSPKLTKQLVSMGISSDVVSLALGAPSLAMLNVPRSRIVTDDVRALEEQGNSIHFDSCQATDPRSKGGVNPSYVAIDGDKKHFGDTLFLWVIGDRMELDGEGYKARAKLRIMFRDEAGRKPAGLYIDTIYGQQELLMQELPYLDSWWKSYSASKGWVATPLLTSKGTMTEIDSSGPDLSRLYCPSAMDGYLDTLERGSGARQPPLRQLKIEKDFPSLVRAVYRYTSEKVTSSFAGELREHTEHTLPRSAYSYNPQRSDSLYMKSPPPADKAWRGVIPTELHLPLQSIFKALGYPDAKKNVSYTSHGRYTQATYENIHGNEFVVSFLKNEPEVPVQVWVKTTKDANQRLLLSSASPNELEVRADLSQFGFGKAQSISPTLHAEFGAVILLEFRGACYFAVRQGGKKAMVVRQAEGTTRESWNSYLVKPLETLQPGVNKPWIIFRLLINALHLRVIRAICQLYGEEYRLGLKDRGVELDLELRW